MRTLDVIQPYIKGQFGQVQIAVIVTSRQRAAFEMVIRGIALVGTAFSTVEQFQNNSGIFAICAGDDLKREGVIALAGDALVHNRLDVACRPRCNLRLVAKHSRFCRLLPDRLVQPSRITLQFILPLCLYFLGNARLVAHRCTSLPLLCEVKRAVT